MTTYTKNRNYPFPPIAVISDLIVSAVLYFIIIFIFNFNVYDIFVA